MMKRIAVLALFALSAVFAAAPSHAADARMSTRTVIKIMPGAATTTFHDGDPIRICAGAVTEAASNETLRMAIEYRAVKDGATWKVIRFDFEANTFGCMFAAIHGHLDMQIRARTLNGPTNLASASRKVTLDVA